MGRFSLGAMLSLTAFGGSLIAQTPPQTGSWTPGWKSTPKALVHVSGLKCPTAPWKGYDTTAPEYFNTDTWFGVKTDAVCQYSINGLDLPRTFTVNLVRTPDVSAAVAAQWQNTQLVAQGRKVTVTSVLDKPVRRGLTYRRMSFNDPSEPRHRNWIITRDKEGQNELVTAYFPTAMSEEKVWAVIDQLFAANT